MGKILNAMGGSPEINYCPRCGYDASMECITNNYGAIKCNNCGFQGYVIESSDSEELNK